MDSPSFKGIECHLDTPLTEEMLMADFTVTMRVSSTAGASDSSYSNNHSVVYLFPPKKDDGVEFGSIFRDACSESKENPGTHQPKGLESDVLPFAPVAMTRIS